MDLLFNDISFLEAMSKTPVSDAVREQAEVYELWLEVCKVRDDMLRRDYHAGRVILLLIARTLALFMMAPPATVLLLVQLPIWLIAKMAGKLPVDKEIVSTLKLATGGLLTMMLYAVVGVMIARRHGWKVALPILLLLPAAGLISMRVFDAASSAARSVPALIRLLWLQPEMDMLRDARERLRKHAEQLLQQTNASAHTVSTAAQKLVRSRL